MLGELIRLLQVLRHEDPATISHRCNHTSIFTVLDDLVHCGVRPYSLV
jgi:hypothetical protein